MMFRRSGGFLGIAVAALVATGCAWFESEPVEDRTVQDELAAFAQELERHHENNGFYPDDAERVASFTSSISDWPITAAHYASDPGTGLGNGRSNNVLYCLPGEANEHQFAVVAVSQSGAVYSATPEGVGEVELSNAEHSADICADGGANLGTTSVNNDHRYWVATQDGWRSWVDIQEPPTE